jgi:hypothetical protein
MGWSSPAHQQFFPFIGPGVHDSVLMMVPPVPCKLFHISFSILQGTYFLSFCFPAWKIGADESLVVDENEEIDEIAARQDDTGFHSTYGPASIPFMGRTTDAGFFVPHVSIPINNSMLPLTIIFGSSISIFGSSRVKLNTHSFIMSALFGDEEQGMACCIPPIPISFNVACQDPIPLPFDLVISPCSVEVGVTLADVVQALIDYALEIVMELGGAALGAGLGKAWKKGKKAFTGASELVEDAGQKAAKESLEELTAGSGWTKKLPFADWGQTRLMRKSTREAATQGAEKAAKEAAEEAAQESAEKLSKEAAGEMQDAAASRAKKGVDAAQESSDDAARKLDQAKADTGRAQNQAGEATEQARRADDGARRAADDAAGARKQADAARKQADEARDAAKQMRAQRDAARAQAEQTGEFKDRLGAGELSKDYDALADKASNLRRQANELDGQAKRAEEAAEAAREQAADARRAADDAGRKLDQAKSDEWKAKQDALKKQQDLEDAQKRFKDSKPGKKLDEAKAFKEMTPEQKAQKILRDSYEEWYNRNAIHSILPADEFDFIPTALGNLFGRGKDVAERLARVDSGGPAGQGEPESPIVEHPFVMLGSPDITQVGDEFVTDNSPIRVRAVFSKKVRGFGVGKVRTDPTGAAGRTPGRGSGSEAEPVFLWSAERFGAEGEWFDPEAEGCDVYDFVVTPRVEPGEYFTVDIDAAQVKHRDQNDLAYPNKAAQQLRVRFENRGPVAVLSSPAEPATNRSPIPVTASFNVAVTGFEAGDLVAAGAQVQGFEALGEREYRFELVPAGPGPVRVEIPAGVATGPGGIDNLASAPLEILFDTSAPQVAADVPVQGTTARSRVPVTQKFDKPVQDFGPDQIELENARIADFTEVEEGRVYRYTLQPESDGPVSARIPTGSVQDAAGNPVGESLVEFAYDSVNPEQYLATDFPGLSSQDLQWIQQGLGIIGTV